MPSPGPGGSQSSLAGAVAWLTSKFRARLKPQPKKGAPIASYTMGTDPTALGGNARGDFRGKITHHVWPDSGARLQSVSVGQISLIRADSRQHVRRILPRMSRPIY
jgi:hypothetical protein